MEIKFNLDTREQECPAVLRKRFKKVDSDDRDLANRKDRKVHMHPQRASFFKFFRSAPVTGANYEEGKNTDTIPI